MHDGKGKLVREIKNGTKIQGSWSIVRLLRQKLPSDKIVSVAVAANPYGWTTGCHGSYDYKALSEYAYLMIMAYDESYQGGPEGLFRAVNSLISLFNMLYIKMFPKRK